MRLAAVIVSAGVVACHTSGIPIETGLQGATTLAVDSTSVYWIENGPLTRPRGPAPGLLRRAGLAGGPPETLASGIPESWDLRLVDGNLYFAGLLDRRIFAVPVSGGIPSVAAAPAAGEQLSAWTVQGIDVFTVTLDGTAYHLRRTPLAGGAAVELHSAPYYRDPYTGPSAPHQLAVTAEAIFFVDYANVGASLVSRILRRPRGDDPALPLTPVYTALTIGNLAVDAHQLYWTEESQQTFRQTVASLSLSEGTSRVLFELSDRGDFLRAAPGGAGQILTLDAVSGSDLRAPKHTIRRIDPSSGGREIADQEEAIDALAARGGVAWYISGFSEIRMAF